MVADAFYLCCVQRGDVSLRKPGEVLGRASCLGSSGTAAARCKEGPGLLLRAIRAFHCLDRDRAERALCGAVRILVTITQGRSHARDHLSSPEQMLRRVVYGVSRCNRKAASMAVDRSHGAVVTKMPRSTARIFGHPIHPMLVPVPIVCFIGTLITDIVYSRTAEMQWANFSSWLLAMGLVVSIFVVIAGVTDFFGDRRVRRLRSAWIHGIGNALALVLSIFNMFVHSRDAYTSVVPTGLTLSAIVVLILVVTGWNGWQMVYRHGVGLELEQNP
jgi:uncharacterized membrane protein